MMPGNLWFQIWPLLRILTTRKLMELCNYHPMVLCKSGHFHNYSLIHTCPSLHSPGQAREHCPQFIWEQTRAWGPAWWHSSEPSGWLPQQGCVLYHMVEVVHSARLRFWALLSSISLRRRTWRGAKHATPNYTSLVQDYLELVIFKKQQTQKNLCKPSWLYPFVRGIYIYKGTLRLSGSPSLYQEEEGD